jgi:hypothetical protein
MIVGADDTFTMGGKEDSPAYLVKELDLEWMEVGATTYAE